MSLEETSGGYRLFVPPTPLHQQPNIILIDDQNDALLSVDYLLNRIPWKDVALHDVQYPAILFPAANDKLHEQDKGIKTNGFLVSIKRHTTDGVFEARIIGTVKVAQYPDKILNWDQLVSMKQPQIVKELRHGLARFMFDNRPEAGQTHFVFNTPAAVLRDMPRPWHIDPAILNEEMDRRFVGAVRIASDQKWRIFP